jgi:hypothetical protein
MRACVLCGAVRCVRGACVVYACVLRGVRGTCVMRACMCSWVTVVRVCCVLCVRVVRCGAVRCGVLCAVWLFSVCVVMCCAVYRDVLLCWLCGCGLLGVAFILPQIWSRSRKPMNFEPCAGGGEPLFPLYHTHIDSLRSSDVSMTFALFSTRNFTKQEQKTQKRLQISMKSPRIMGLLVLLLYLNVVIRLHNENRRTFN